MTMKCKIDCLCFNSDLCRLSPPPINYCNILNATIKKYYLCTEMRFIAIILVTYISLLTVSPAVCGLYETIKQVDLCCSSDSNKKCSNEPSGNKTQKQKDKSESDAPYAPCCSVQNCQCYFVTAPQLDFGIQLVTITEKIRIKNETVISNYSSDCWQPPEKV